jgi:hypothetical protein
LQSGPSTNRSNINLRDLALILDRWANLPATIRRAVRALVESVGPGE